MSGRNRMLGAVHAAANAQGLKGEAYRDMLENLTGKRSAGDLNHGQMAKVLDHLNGKVHGMARGPGPALSGLSAGDPQAAKVMALWRSLALMGVVDGKVRALDSWCERTAKVSALRFATPVQKNLLIEGLKDWCKREGFTVPQTKPGQGDGGLSAKQELVGVLWDLLGKAGALHVADRAALCSWLQGRHMSHYGGLIHLSAAQAEAAAAELAAWLARVRGKADPKETDGGDTA